MLNDCSLSFSLDDFEFNVFFFNCLHTSIVLYVTGEIHSYLQVIVYHITSLADSIIAVLKSSMVISVSSWMTLKRFLSVMMSFSLISAFFIFDMSSCWFLVIPVVEFLIFATPTLWSLPTSAFLIARAC